MGPERCRAELAVEKTTRSISFDGVSVGRYCGVGRLGDAASRRTCCTSRCGCARGYGWRCMQLRCFGKFIVSAPSFYRMYAFMECGSGLDAIRSRRLSFCPFREGGGNCAFASHRRISNKASGREVRAVECSVAGCGQQACRVVRIFAVRHRPFGISRILCGAAAAHRIHGVGVSCSTALERVFFFFFGGESKKIMICYWN